MKAKSRMSFPLDFALLHIKIKPSRFKPSRYYFLNTLTFTQQLLIDTLLICFNEFVKLLTLCHLTIVVAVRFLTADLWLQFGAGSCTLLINAGWFFSVLDVNYNYVDLVGVVVNVFLPGEIEFILVFREMKIQLGTGGRILDCRCMAGMVVT